MGKKNEKLDEFQNFSFLEEENYYDNGGSNVKINCLHCRYTEMVPGYILDEMSRKKYHFKIKKVYTLTCQKGFKESAIPPHHLKK